VLYGSSPENFLLKLVLGDRGCVDARSVCSVGSDVVFGSQKGLERFDGVQARTLSAPIESEWQSEVNLTGQPGSDRTTTAAAAVRCFALPNDYLMVILQPSDYVTTPYLLHHPTGSWSTIATAFDVLVSAPQLALVGTRTLTLWAQYTWGRSDKLTFGPDANTGLVDYTPAGVATDVTLRWITRAADLGARWSTATLTRFAVDLKHRWGSGVATGATLFTCLLRDLFDPSVTLLSKTILGYSATNAHTRVRPVVDVGSELPRGDFTLELSHTGGADTTTRCSVLSVYGAGAEYEPARNRRL
jgi:hypothetical protein